VATHENEAKLLDMALLATGAQLERLCRGYRQVLDGERAPRPEERSVRQRLLPGGMARLELVLEPDEADLILRAIERAREVRAGQAESIEQEDPGAPGTPDAPDAGVSSGAAQTAGVSAETLRRVACDCGLVAVGSDGQALNIGRRARTIPPAIRRALMLRDRGCAFPGCTYTRFLHGHHVKHWLHGGETSLENLLMLCTAHHHLVHEGGWTVTAGAEGDFVFHSPAGELVAPEPQRELVGDTVDWLRGWADERNLDLGPEINMPQWDGKIPDYECATEWLLAAGQ
jgi:hypothetical protein